ncbi:MAG: putative co-chaperone, DnaJ family [Pseudomonadota bacterium]|jgi:molecular chaperone HscB
MNLTDNDFVLFALPEQFAQDRARVDAQWKALQRQAHPDQFAAEGAAAQRMAMQWSVRINEAYSRLKDPLKRAAYLCELRGAPIAAQTNTAMPASFLMQQMHWREELEESKSEDDLDALTDELDTGRRAELAAIETLLDGQGSGQSEFAQAAQHVRALMFMEKFGHELEARYDALQA